MTVSNGAIFNAVLHLRAS